MQSHQIKGPGLAMDYSIKLTPAAQRDRDAIIEYLLDKLHAPGSAAKFMDRLDEAIGMLQCAPESFPRSREPRLHKLGYHKAPIMNYLALYRIEGQAAIIVRIVHQTQDYARLL